MFKIGEKVRVKTTLPVSDFDETVLENEAPAFLRGRVGTYMGEDFSSHIVQFDLAEFDAEEREAMDDDETWYFTAADLDSLAELKKPSEQRISELTARLDKAERALKKLSNAAAHLVESQRDLERDALQILIEFSESK